MVNATVRAVEGDVLVLSIGSGTARTATVRGAQHRRDRRCPAGRPRRAVARPVRPRRRGSGHPSAGRPAPRAVATGSRPAFGTSGWNPAAARAATGRRAPDDEEAMLAEAAAGPTAPAVRRDPEEVAMELLSAQLGARRSIEVEECARAAAARSRVTEL